MLFCQWQQLQCLYSQSLPLCPIPFSTTAYMWQIVVHTSVGLGDSIASIGASYAILCLNQFALNRWIQSVMTHSLFRDQNSGSTFAYSITSLTLLNAFGCMCWVESSPKVLLEWPGIPLTVIVYGILFSSGIFTKWLKFH